MYKIVRPGSNLAGYNRITTCSAGAIRIFFTIACLAFILALGRGVIDMMYGGNWGERSEGIGWAMLIVCSIIVVPALIAYVLHRLDWLKPVVRALEWLIVTNSIMALFWRFIGFLGNMFFHKHIGKIATHSFLLALPLTIWFMYDYAKENHLEYFEVAIEGVSFLLSFWLLSLIACVMIVGTIRLLCWMTGLMNLNWQPFLDHWSFISDWYHKACRQVLVVPEGAVMRKGWRIMNLGGQDKATELFRLDHLDIALVQLQQANTTGNEDAHFMCQVCVRTRELAEQLLENVTGLSGDLTELVTDEEVRYYLLFTEYGHPVETFSLRLMKQM